MLNVFLQSWASLSETVTSYEPVYGQQLKYKYSQYIYALDLRQIYELWICEA